MKRVGDNCKDKYFKFVGIKLDEHLTWDHQISHVYQKLISGNFVLNRCKNVLPINIRRLIYITLIQSHHNMVSLLGEVVKINLLPV